jgi:thioester reductase-like protein
MSSEIVLSGATGFLGMELLAQLIDQGEHVTAIIRAEDDTAAQTRLDGIFDKLYDERPAGVTNVRAVSGDLLLPGLGMSSERSQRLFHCADRLIHCAASISFAQPLSEARAVNVGGVRRMIELARQIAATGTLRRFVHVSTAFVSGAHEGVFGEDDLDLGQSFRNSYERSKNEAEHVLAEANDLSVVVVRPSMVVGHQVSGWTPAFNVLYWPIRAFQRGLLSVIPARPDSVVDFVPVDHVAAAIVSMTDSSSAHGTYSVVAGSRAPTASRMVELLTGGGGSTTVALRPLRDGETLPLGADALLPYFDVRTSFSDSRAQELLARGELRPVDPEQLLPRLLDYAHQTAWGKRPMTRQASLRPTNAAVPGG